MRFVLAILIALSSVFLVGGCKPYAPPIAHPIVDCVNADRPAIESLILSFWPKDGGVPNWASVESAAINAGINVGGCAIAEYIQQYTAPKPGTAAPPDGLQAVMTLEHYRSITAPDTSFKTKYGSL